MTNPYSNLPSHCFWRRAVERIEPFAVDPVVHTSFALEGDDRIATAGSCFAQHISRALTAAGHNYYVAETRPSGMSMEVAGFKNFGTFSARFGNIYTTRQLLQLFRQAYGRFQPAEAPWRRADGRYVDPFRPQIDPEGASTEDEVSTDRVTHLATVRRMFETMTVFVFTLGLTEGWRSKVDGAVFPISPGVVAGEFDDSKYEFVNFDIHEVEDDLSAFISELRAVNPTCKILLTVSPVPLVATYEQKHVLVSTTYSKAVLRVAAENVRKRHPLVDYFPSYEIISGNFNHGSYFEDDLRNVTKEGVAHVMRVFFRHYADGATKSEADLVVDASLAARRAAIEIICDEEALDAGA